VTYAPAVAPGWLRRNRGFLLLAGGLVVVLTALALLTAGGGSGVLDPDAYNPSGAHALSVLLQQQGVHVERTTDLPSTQARADDRTTVFVPLPQLLSDEELQALSDLPGDLVVTDAHPVLLRVIDESVTSAGQEAVRAREPGCSSITATRAGRAEVGGFTYEGRGACYGGALLEIPASGLVLLGSSELMQNDHLAHEGNASLAIGLLCRQPSLLWLVPDPARPEIGTRRITAPSDLLPDWVFGVVLQLALALVVLALWRGRRLGRVVPEPLPVVVRAAETVEGRGRLYRAAHARGGAAEELRGGARQRLGPRVGAGRSPTPQILTTAVAGRTGRSTEEISALLYGPEPADDVALVRLADDLDALIREVTSS
jgi:hypothetical protein